MRFHGLVAALAFVALINNYSLGNWEPSPKKVSSSASAEEEALDEAARDCDAAAGGDFDVSTLGLKEGEIHTLSGLNPQLLNQVASSRERRLLQEATEQRIFENWERLKIGRPYLMRDGSVLTKTSEIDSLGQIHFTLNKVEFVLMLKNSENESPYRGVTPQTKEQVAQGAPNGATKTPRRAIKWIKRLGVVTALAAAVSGTPTAYHKLTNPTAVESPSDFAMKWRSASAEEQVEIFRETVKYLNSLEAKDEAAPQPQLDQFLAVTMTGMSPEQFAAICKSFSTGENHGPKTFILEKEYVEKNAENLEAILKAQMLKAQYSQYSVLYYYIEGHPKLDFQTFMRILRVAEAEKYGSNNQYELYRKYRMHKKLTLEQAIEVESVLGGGPLIDYVRDQNGAISYEVLERVLEKVKARADCIAVIEPFVKEHLKTLQMDQILKLHSFMDDHDEMLVDYELEHIAEFSADDVRRFMLAASKAESKDRLARYFEQFNKRK